MSTIALAFVRPAAFRRDLEMETIRSLLEEFAAGRFHDIRPGWGEARTSRYRDAIRQAIDDGLVPVLVELEDDLGLDPSRVVVVDHHGERAGRERATALEQVFDLLELPARRWTRRLDLVGANDRAYLAGLRQKGASREEMETIRRQDRRAQGITEAEERQAEQALEQIESHLDGRLLVADLPHARTAALVDRLAPELGGPGFENLLVRSPREVNVFGTGDVIGHLAALFPEEFCRPRIKGDLMKTLNARVLDPKHLELSEPLPLEAGEWVQIVVSDSDDDSAGWRQAATEHFLNAYDDQDAIYDDL